jgi:hypothetical protein
VSTYEQLRRQYINKHRRLVAPTQGFGSLYEHLWLAYSMVVKRGYYDVGTYANKPGDHSWGDRHGQPGVALAFDMRRKGWLGRFGWGFRNARKTAEWLWDNHVALNIDYVIVGRQIISRQKPYWHPLTTGDTSHDWHIHVSGVA